MISLCKFVVFCVIKSRAVKQEFGTMQYLMKYFVYWIFYVWIQVQYCTILTITIVTQIPYIVSFMTYGLQGYYFYVPGGYYINLFYDNVVFVGPVVCLHT